MVLGLERGPRRRFVDRTIRLGVYKRYLFIGYRLGNAVAAEGTYMRS